MTEISTGTQSHVETHEVPLFAEPVFKNHTLIITNSLILSWIAVFVIVVLVYKLRTSLKTIPQGLQNVFEIFVEGALNLCDQVTGARSISLKVFPIVASVFLFILVNNWLGIFPGVGSIGNIVTDGGHSVFVPFLRGGTADINTTLALGIFGVLGSNIFGIITIGLWKTFNKYVNIRVLGSMVTKVRKDPTVLFVAPISFFVGILEIIGECAKIASLSFRLFGNIFAGEVLLASMSVLSAFILPIPFIFLEIFVGLVQALIFSLLVLVYFTIASEDHSGEEHV